MSDDATLVRQYVTEGSESAFAELVSRHVSLVHSVALRCVGGDAHRAQDVTQAVFCELARKAPHLISHRALSGWLYTTARHIGRRSRRAEIRRVQRELAHQGPMQIQGDGKPELAWAELLPVLDEAMGELGERDRHAIVLRFFENKRLADVGVGLGLTENAARMRVDRALGKLRGLLARRGINSTASALCASILTNAVAPAPTGLAASLVGPAVASAFSTGSTAGLTAFSFLNIMNSTKLAVGVAAVALTGAVGTFVKMGYTNSKLRTELMTLRNQAPPAPEPVQVVAPNASETEELARLRAEHGELLRLKGEVGLLRQAQTELARLRAEQTERDRANAGRTAEEKIRKAVEDLAGTKMNFTVPWAEAFQAFARNNGGKMPEAFDQVTNYIPQAVQAVAFSFPTDDFEIVYRGLLEEIKEPARTIIVREKQPFNVQASGEAWRTYLFADGHSEVHLARDGNFGPWEQQHIVSSR
ncbi:MAG: sigma-70 family RNA polymerase sigma factor [Verrucomicrobiota bacterium]